MNRKTVAIHSLFGLSAILYVILGYFTPRADFTQLLFLYTACFAAYVYLINRRFSVWLGIGAAIFFRLLLLFATPPLSDDYLRLIWDGRILAAGFSPYLHLPTFFVSDAVSPVAGITDALFQRLSEPGLYSLNLPLAQAVAWLGVTCAPDSIAGSVVTIRVVILLAETFSIILLLRLLRKMGMPDRNVLLYALNPLVILELTGNLHLEALMIFFVLMAVYQIFYQRVLVAGCVYALAVGTSLLPLLFLPFVWRRLGTRQFALFATAMILTILLLFYPFYSWDGFTNVLHSFSLYMQQQEFNASLYYMLRWLAEMLIGNTHLTALGPLLLALTLILTGAIAMRKKLGSVKRMTGYMAAALTIFLLLATNVPPWHLAILVALTVPSHFRFAVVWSGLGFLSYAAYRTSNFKEDTALLLLEYSLVLLWLLVELYLYRQRIKHVNLH